MAVMIKRRKEKKKKSRLESRKTGFEDRWAIEGVKKEMPGS
jgi:hypothetical protein